MVVTDEGKVLKPISAREKATREKVREEVREKSREEVPAKERWRAAATKGGKGKSESSTKEGVNKGQVEGKPTMKVEKEVVSMLAAKKPSVSKMNWKAAVAKQAGRNGYKPIMTDQGFVVVRKDSNGGLKPTKNCKKKDDQIIKPTINEINNVTGSKDFLGSGLDEVDGSELKQNDRRNLETSRENEKAPGKEEKKEDGENKKEGDEGSKEVTRPAQRPSSLKLRSQHKQQRSQDQQDISNEVNDKHQDKDQLSNKKQQEHANELSTKMWMKEKEAEEPHASLPQRGWTSWQEMAEKKCPTKNLIVFN